jgi:hypothetical protein
MTFFREYAKISLGDEPEKLAAFYDEAFLVAGPAGSAAFQNNDDFLVWLRQVHDFNQTSGMTGMEVVGVADSPLSANYTLTTVEWGARFEKTGDELITFEITYILRTSGETPKIVGYISHEDQEEAMKERGLL